MIKIKLSFCRDCNLPEIVLYYYNVIILYYYKMGEI